MQEYSLNTYASLSNAAYDSNAELPSGWTRLDLPPPVASNPVNGFQGSAFQNEQGDVIIAYAGTDFTDLSGDVLNDIMLGLGQKPGQLENANALYDYVSNNYPNAEISLTGHSLGGALAQLVIANKALQALNVGNSDKAAEIRHQDVVTFNAPGVMDILSQTARDHVYPNVINLVYPGDLVSLIGEHIGSTFEIPLSLYEEMLDAIGYIVNPFLQLIDNHVLASIRNQIRTSLRDLWNSAQLLNPFKDPLTLDLDGDGIETVAASTTNPILFDHDGDGTKNGTGWIKADDGFLVLDRNNNGTIDSGQELFGDSTPLAGGEAAADGFAALAQEDTNADGVVNNLDTRWSQLRVWQDLNQDGISQAGELLTMRAFSTAPLCFFYTA